MLRAVVTKVRSPTAALRCATTSAAAPGKEGDQRVEGWRREDRYWEKQWKQTEARRVS